MSNKRDTMISKFSSLGVWRKIFLIILNFILIGIASIFIFLSFNGYRIVGLTIAAIPLLMTYCITCSIVNRNLKWLKIFSLIPLFTFLIPGIFVPAVSLEGLSISAISTIGMLISSGLVAATRRDLYGNGNENSEIYD